LTFASFFFLVSSFFLSKVFAPAFFDAGVEAIFGAGGGSRATDGEGCGTGDAAGGGDGGKAACAVFGVDCFDGDEASFGSGGGGGIACRSCPACNCSSVYCAFWRSAIRPFAIRSRSTLVSALSGCFGTLARLGYGSFAPCVRFWEFGALSLASADELPERSRYNAIGSAPDPQPERPIAIAASNTADVIPARLPRRFLTIPPLHATPRTLSPHPGYPIVQRSGQAVYSICNRPAIYYGLRGRNGTLYPSRKR